jgi:hypothetical protein
MEERETAEEYQQWAASRSLGSETWLIRVLVPRIFLESLRQQTLFFSPDRKEYVWYCKRGFLPPPKFDKLCKTGETDVIQGHTCKCPDNIITRSKKEGVQEKYVRSMFLWLMERWRNSWC